MKLKVLPTYKPACPEDDPKQRAELHSREYKGQAGMKWSLLRDMEQQPEAGIPIVTAAYVACQLSANCLCCEISCATTSEKDLSNLS